MDFTLKTYNELLRALKGSGYKFYTFLDHFKHQNERIVVLRHDVDRLSGNALRIAELEAEMEVKASYYFRATPESFDEGIIKSIAGMGHEIGYHYENLAYVAKHSEVRSKKSEASKNERQLYELAIEDFKTNLGKFRAIVPIKTICMHGSPTSRFDSRDLWKKYNYRDFGIIGEPYFDIDFSKVLYLTDTGRRWDGGRYNIRDRVINSDKVTGGRKQGTSQNSLEKTERLPETCNLQPSLRHSFHSTFDIINALEKDLLPDQIMINTHPQRWTNNPFLWTKELVWQNTKNLIKSFYV